MPELELQQAVTMAKRLRTVVEESVFVISETKRESKVTISIGVAWVAGSGDITPEELVKKADDALYLSKRNGRNQVTYIPT